MRAGDDGEEAPPEPIAVDHDVEAEKEGAQPVRDRGQKPQGIGERRGADGARQRVGLEAAKPCGERGGQMGAGEMVCKLRAKRGLLFEKRHRLRQQGWNRENDEEKREDEEGREDDRDSEPSPHALPFEPADGRAQRAGDEESGDKHEEDGPEPDQQPKGNDEENEHPHGFE